MDVKAIALLVIVAKLLNIQSITGTPIAMIRACCCSGNAQILPKSIINMRNCL